MSRPPRPLLDGASIGIDPRVSDNLSMPNIGPLEIGLVLLVALLVLGPKKLPSAGRSLGESIRGFKDAVSTKGPAEPAALEAEAARVD
jgi:sec-independent protein translocase protein TatA